MLNAIKQWKDEYRKIGSQKDRRELSKKHNAKVDYGIWEETIVEYEMNE